MKKLFSVVLCLCICICLSACQREPSSSSVNDSYIEGVDQGKEDFFLDLWQASYNLNTKKCGDLWETDDFSLMITTKRKTEVYYDENAPYIELDFTLNEGTIENYYEGNEILFCIYSQGKDGWSRIWDSNIYYDYFLMQGDDGIIGRSGNADVRIYEGTNRLAVLIVINGSVYAASYSVDI